MDSGNIANERTLARILFVTLAASFVTLLIMAGLPATVPTFAQSTPGPSGSAPTSFKIQFLNPSGTGHSEAISANDDASEGESDQKYHLVAWVNALPDDAKVEFKYQVDGQNEEKLIGIGRSVAPGDTFDLQWTIPDEIPEYNTQTEDTGFSLIAILYSGNTEVARDTESDIQKNDASPPNPSHPEDNQARGVAVEITDPTSGGAMGFFTPKDQEPRGVIDFTKTSGSNFVTVRYSISAPGDEPAWKSCGSAADNDAPCVLAPGDDISEITAISATATTRQCDPFGFACSTTNTGSGDADRIASYAQVPSTLTLTPDRYNDVANNVCTQDFVATVTDQHDRTIVNAPIDIHAQGPTDELFFSEASGEPPENHGQEEAIFCDTDPPSKSPGEGNEQLIDPIFQGEHNDPSGVDLKHSESPLATSQTGTYAFALYSPDQGVTQLTAFVDVDEDDEFCSAEPSDDASIGWQEGAPDPVGLEPEESTCPVATPSPVPTRTSSPTPTESPTQDPRGCTIQGTPENETLTGTDDDDVICADGGDDIVRGLGGNDVIYGDAGADEIRGGPGNDFIEGGSGKDIMRGEDGDDGLEGGGGNDAIGGGLGRDVIKGQRGFDTLRGAQANDRIAGNAGDDILTGGGGRDRLNGGPGRDILNGNGGRDRCRGGPGRDRLRRC